MQNSIDTKNRVGAQIRYDISVYHFWRLFISSGAVNNADADFYIISIAEITSSRRIFHNPNFIVESREKFHI